MFCAHVPRFSPPPDAATVGPTTRPRSQPLPRAAPGLGCGVPARPTGRAPGCAALGAVAGRAAPRRRAAARGDGADGVHAAARRVCALAACTRATGAARTALRGRVRARARAARPAPAAVAATATLPTAATAASATGALPTAAAWADVAACS